MLGKLRRIAKILPKYTIPVLLEDRSSRKKHTAKLNLPPGSLIYTGDEQELGDVSMQWIRFNEHEMIERADDFTLDDVVDSLDEQHTTWLNIHGLSNLELIREIGEKFNLEKIVLEDLLELGQRPKVEEYEGYLFFTLKSIRLYESDKVMMEQMSFVLGDNFIISFQEKKADIFEHIRERLRTTKALIRTRKADYILYLMLDSIVDHYIILSQELEDRIDIFQIIVTQSPNNISLIEIEDLKRIFIKLKRAIWPVRDSVSFLHNGGSGRIRPEIKMYFSDLNDLVLTVIDSIESNRQVIDGFTNIYLSSLSNKTNEIMKVLTVISAIFLPLTFIAGVYGMNFHNMPELSSGYGYFVVLGVMAMIGAIQLYMFKRRGWFD